MLIEHFVERVSFRILLSNDVPVMKKHAKKNQSKVGREDRPTKGFRLRKQPVSRKGATKGKPPSAAHAGSTDALRRPSITLMARDPRSLHGYWDFDPAFLPESAVVSLKFREGVHSHSIAVGPAERSRDFQVRQGQTSCRVELGYVVPGKPWRTMALSNEVVTPSEGVSEDQSVELVGVPLHLSYQLLLEFLENNPGQFPDLEKLLAEHTCPEGEPLIAQLTEEERRSLRSWLRARPSPTPAASTPAAPPSTTPAGNGRGIPGSWASSWQTAWDQSGPGGFSSASWWESGPASPEFWLAAGGSSMLSAPGASWSSPFQARGPSEALPAGAEDFFFLHLNAEVIFYGGTRPGARLFIDNREVPVQSDGSFRYHFIFPNHRHEIPIRAVWPPTGEERSALLRLDRVTEADPTKVGRSSQSLDLNTLIGRLA